MNHYEWFMNKCKTFEEWMSFDDYCRYVSKCLVFLSYNYFPDEAINTVKTSMKIVKNYYKRKESIYSCAVDIGYTCG